MPELKWYALDPIDLLLMRESKPFSPGDGSWAKGQFPPLPNTVFQAMRSATPWLGNQSDRRNAGPWLEFMGPFLLYAPPDKPASLWLKTPQDLVCVNWRRTADQDSNEAEEDFTETATQWQRTARFQPLDRQNPSWKYLGLDPDFFPADQLAPMVPPKRLGQNPTDDSRSESRDASDPSNELLRTNAEQWEGIAGRPDPWIRADILVRYLKGEVIKKPTDETVKQTGPYFHKDPWGTQVLPHIKVQPGTRQVADEEGYFTEVAIRMEPHWHLVAGISAVLQSKVVRLGGEGHRVLVTPMATLPPYWEELQAFLTPKTGQETAYALTPGLAETDEGDRFGLVPESWKSQLRSCVGDRPLLWGGMSLFQKPGSQNRAVAFQPQRAFVPPGTVYRFKPGHVQSDSGSGTPPRLLPQTGGNWLTTLTSLHYGLLLWGK